MVKVSWCFSFIRTPDISSTMRIYHTYPTHFLWYHNLILYIIYLFIWVRCMWFAGWNTNEYRFWERLFCHYHCVCLHRILYYFDELIKLCVYIASIYIKYRVELPIFIWSDFYCTHRCSIRIYLRKVIIRHQNKQGIIFFSKILL